MVHEQKSKSNSRFGIADNSPASDALGLMPEGLPKGQAKCPGAEPAGKPIRDARQRVSRDGVDGLPRGDAQKGVGQQNLGAQPGEPYQAASSRAVPFSGGCRAATPALPEASPGVEPSRRFLLVLSPSAFHQEQEVRGFRVGQPPCRPRPPSCVPPITTGTTSPFLCLHRILSFLLRSECLLSERKEAQENLKDDSKKHNSSSCAVAKTE